MLGIVIGLVLVIIMICIICNIIDFVRYCINDNQVPEEKKYLTDADRRYYYNKLDEIMKLCWNKDTYIFNWDIWFERRDEVIWCGDESVLKTIDDDFRAYGNFQVDHINACLENSFQCGSDVIRDDMVRKLKNMQNDIILNLAGMYSYKNAVYNVDNCPEIVDVYRGKLYSLIRGEIAWTRENIKTIVELGDNITGIRRYV